MVSDHPYVAVTDENGNFEITNVPSGTYELMFWQEKLSNLPKKKFIKVNHLKTVTVSGEVADGSYVFPKPEKKPKK